MKNKVTNPRWALITCLLLATPARAQKEPGVAWVEPITTMEFVWVPAGSFLMGSPPDERTDEDADERQHQVTLSSEYYIGKYEVTKAAFKKFVDETGYETEAEIAGFSYTNVNGEYVKRPLTWRDTVGDSCPVVNVTWNPPVSG